MPQERIDAERRRAMVQELLAQLPEEQAETLALRVVMGFSLGEVADATQTPLNTVRSRIRLAKEALRKRIDGEPLPPPEEVQACRDALDACLVATPSETETCRDTAHACVRDAFAAAFQARCEEAATRCAEPGAPADKCAHITARCAQGVDGLPAQEAATTCAE